MNALSTSKLVYFITAQLILVSSIAFMIGAVMTTAWEVYEDPGTWEIHQHGLWLDYFYTRHHVANRHNEFSWLAKLKIGLSVIGDEVHRAQAYQINTLILLCVATVCAIAGSVLSWFASKKRALVIGWALTIAVATLLSVTALILFYMESLTNRFINTDRKLEQKIGYSYWLALVGAIGYFISIPLAIGYSFMNNKERNHPNFQAIEARPKHITSL